MAVQTVRSDKQKTKENSKAPAPEVKIDKVNKEERTPENRMCFTRINSFRHKTHCCSKNLNFI